MRNKIGTPCLDNGCFEDATYQGRCEKHQKVWEGSTRGERLPKNWNVIRSTVLTRDKGICYLCGGQGADAVDHVNRGDNHALWNLKAVHDRTPPHCHRYKSSQEGHAARWAGKPPF